jgi:hypothetical protein
MTVLAVPAAAYALCLLLSAPVEGSETTGPVSSEKEVETGQEKPKKKLKQAKEKKAEATQDQPARAKHSEQESIDHTEEDVSDPAETKDAIGPNEESPQSVEPHTGNDDTVVVIIDDQTSPEAATSPDGDLLFNEVDDEIIILDSAEEEISPDTSRIGADMGSRTWVRTGLSSRLAVDSNFDTTTREDVAEWWNRATLRMDTHFAGQFRAVIEGRLLWSLAVEDTKPLSDFMLVNGLHPKWLAEVELREAFVSLSFGAWEFNVGQRIFVWGKNEVFSPADGLNPRDFRFDPLSQSESPKDSKVPVFALEAVYHWSDFMFQGVLIPFFETHRSYLLGRDFSLASPGSAARIQLQNLGSIHPSIEDDLQNGVVGTEIPDESILNMSGALRMGASLGGWDVAMSLSYTWDRNPELNIDSELRSFASQIPTLLNEPGQLNSNPQLAADLANLQTRFALGESLVDATYQRMWLVAAEGEGVVGDVVLRVDLGWSPAQIYYDTQLESYRLPSLQGTFGMEYSYGQEVFFSLSAFGWMLWDVPSGALLGGLEGVDTNPSERDKVFVVGALSGLRWLWESYNIELSLSVGGTALPGDWLVGAQLAYRDLAPHVLTVGGLYMDGQEGGVGYRFRHNDYLFVSYGSQW